MIRRPPHLALIVAAASIAVGVSSAIAGAPPGQLYVSPAGSDAGLCSKQRPCASFGRAFSVAKPGQIVEVAAGSYPDQEVNPVQARQGAAVVFRPKSGALVKVADLDVRGSRVEFRNLWIRQWEALETATYVTFRNVRGRGFWITGASNVRVLGGSAGPGVDEHPQIAAAYASGRVPRNILIDGVLFHDWSRSGPAAHTECLQIGGGDGITIRRSRFKNCAVMDLQISHWGNSPLTRNVLVENNFFDEPTDEGPFSIQANDFENLVIRNNSALAGFVIFDREGNGPVTLSANVAPAQPWECNDAVIYRYNVWTNARCDKTDLRGSQGFRDPSRLDLRLQPGSPGIDRGNPASYPRTDIFGKRRPSGRAPDAGAAEAP